MNKQTVKINGENFIIELGKYVTTGNTSIILHSIDDPTEYRKVTVNLEDHIFPATYLLVKTWPENESWIHKFIEQTNLINPKLVIPSGFVEVPIYVIPPEGLIITPTDS